MLFESDIKRLEDLIDRYNLGEVLSALSYICGEKAEHLATLWQDTTTAKRWLQLSAELDKLTAMAEEANL